MAKAELRVSGIVPIIPTPFTADEQVDWPSLRRLVEFACGTNACAMCLPGYASEFYKLSDGERLRVVAEAVQQSAGRLPVFAQVNFVSARQAVESAREAQKPESRRLLSRCHGSSLLAKATFIATSTVFFHR
jgi:dihydrodipicolinate synthase/N-acetylneuraminate lyase